MSFINLGEADPLAQQIQAGTQAAQAGFSFLQSIFGPGKPPPQPQPIPQPQVIAIPQPSSGVDPKILMIGGGAAALIVIAMLLKKKGK